nr:hypothetical protein [Tanacetum cinerariifolium]
MKETPYELLKDIKKKQLRKNEEAMVTIYNALPRKDQRGSNEDVDEEEKAKVYFLARNFRKFFRKGNRFSRENRFSNGANKFGKGCGNSFGNKCGESSKPNGACNNCGIEGRFASECRKPKENKAFIEGSWSNSEDGDEH